MLDIKKIKENPDAVKAGLKAKEVDCDAVVDRILELDVQIRGLKTSTETQTAQKNKLAKENGKLFGQKKGAEKQGQDTSAIDAQIETNKAGVDQAVKANQIMEKSFRIGAASYLDLRDSENALLSAQLAYYQSIHNWLTAQSQLSYLLGDKNLEQYKK